MGTLKERYSKKKEYTYLFIDNSLYINLEGSLLNIMFYLYFRAKPFKFLERKTNIKLLNLFVPIVRIIRVLQFTFLFMKKKHKYLKSKDSFLTITTIFFGHCLLILRQGEYKIINFKKKDVITVYPNNFSPNEIEKNIRKLRESQKCSLTPKIINWDINGRYIKECYLNLKTPSYDFNNRQDFYLEFFPILESIMLSTSPQVILLSQYAQNLINRIDFYFETYLNKDSHARNNTKIILEFFSLIKREMGIFPSTKDILLVLSHGDLSEGNVLKSKAKTGVLDWNTLDFRSCFFDFYYIMFDLSFKTNEAERMYISKEMETAFKYFQMHLKESDIFNSKVKTRIINQPETYRYLFYLEFILLRLQEYAKRNQRNWNFLMNWINIFKFYENIKKEAS
jgi:thiamine kinase-like enzyme